jgi:hypothetical protein
METAVDAVPDFSSHEQTRKLRGLQQQPQSEWNPLTRVFGVNWFTGYTF